MSSQPSLARNTLLTAFSQYAEFALGVVRLMLLARWVPVAQHAVLAAALPWVSYLSFLRPDFRPAMLRAPSGSIWQHTHFWLEFGTGLLALPLAGLAWWLLPVQFSPGTTTWLVILGLLLVSWVESSAAVARYQTEKQLRFDVLSYLQLAKSLLSFGLPLLLALWGKPLWSLFVAQAFPGVFLGLSIWLWQGYRPRWQFDRAVAHTLWQSGFLQWTNGLLGKIVFEFDDWLVATYQKSAQPVWQSSGSLAAGLYNKAYTAGKMPMDVFAGFLGSLALPLYSKAFVAGLDELRAIYRQWTVLLAYLIGFSAAVLLAATPEVVWLVLGKNWLATTPLFRLMGLFVLGRPLYQNATQLLTACHLEREQRQTTLWQAIFLLCCAPVAVYFYGAAGVATAVSLMTLLGLYLAERYVTNALGGGYWQLYLLPLGLAIALWLGTTLLQNQLAWVPTTNWHYLMSLAVKILLAGLVFGLAGWLTQRELLRAAFQQLRQSR